MENRFYIIVAAVLMSLTVQASTKADSKIKELNAAIQVADKVKTNKLLQDKSIDLNHTDEEGMTPLMSAVQSGNLGLVKILLQKKVNLEIKNNLGDTALAIAVGVDQPEAAQLLIDAGANVDIALSTENKDTLLIAAAKSNLNTTKSILKKNNKLINKANKEGDTALMKSIEAGYNDITKLLLSKGADVKVKNKEGKTALDIAKESNNTEAIKLLSAKK